MDDARKMTIMQAINELNKYTLGKKNTEKVEISVLQLNRVIKALEQEPCNDAISREMALKECHDMVVDGERYRVIQEETLSGLPSVTQKSNNKYRKEAKRWKNKWLKSQKSGKWIPVSERLPEGNEKVLVCGVEAINNSHVYAVKNWDVDTWRPLSAPSCKWLAWMPLPKPYEPQESENEHFIPIQSLTCDDITDIIDES